MPENLFNRDFAAGWCPSDDAVNGRANALLQMDNLELDQNGALQLTGGTRILYSGYSANAFTLFSRFINNVRYDYACLVDGTIYRNNTQIAAGGDSKNAAFGTAFNFVLIASGVKRYKDNGSVLVNLGILPPTIPPTVTQSTSNAPWATIGPMQSNYLVIDGLGVTVISGNYIQLEPNVDGKFIMQTYIAPTTPYNCTVLAGPAGSGTSTEEDIIVLNGYMINPFGVSLQFDVLLRPPNTAGDLVSDFYSWVVQDIAQFAGFETISGVFTLKMRRSEFIKNGGGAFDWSTVYGFRLTINMNREPETGEMINIWGAYMGLSAFVIQGGTGAQFGTYQYAQVNVNNTGSYIAKSILGPATNPITIDGTTALITVQNPTTIDPQCNEAWIFRTGGNLGGGWFRVLVVRSNFSTPVYDNMGDQLALTLNITFNPNLVSIASPTISDNIYDIIGPIQGRWFYFTTNFMYPSEINNPDLVDASIAVRICGSTSELLMWARAISASIVLVGTSIDCYLLSGTFSTFPDGSIDVYYQPLGMKFPPVSYDAVSFSGTIYYLAADGWRSLVPQSQNNQTLVAPNTDRLYKGETCYGYQPFIGPVNPGATRFPLAIAKNKLWCFITGTQRGEVLDFVRQYWRVLNYGLGDVNACFATQDNKVLAFYGTDKALREIDYYGNKLIDNTRQQDFKALFTFKDNGKPRQRKDTYTFKSRCYTSQGNSLIIVFDETGNIYAPGTLVVPGKVSREVYLDLAIPLGNNLPKSYQIALSGKSDDLCIEDWSIDYDARPVPLTYLKIVHENYGTTARKRLYTIPFQIDTLGTNVLIQPICDGLAYPILTTNTLRKQSVDYFFNLSGLELVPVARDYDWVINGQGKEFEWYGFNQIRNLEIFPDPCTSYIIPNNNYGIASKKRFRTWPFLINTNGKNVTFTPLVDHVPTAPSIFNTGLERATVFHYFTTDVFGIDYSGTFFDPTGSLEIWKVFPPESGAGLPDSVQNMPIAHKFDQVGPLEIFRWGKIVRMALRTQSDGSIIPFKVYISDVLTYQGDFNVTPGVEGEYVVDLPKGVSGSILRVELGPCSFTFSRYYMKFQVAISGAQKDTELAWITVPGQMVGQ